MTFLGFSFGGTCIGRLGCVRRKIRQWGPGLRPRSSIFSIDLKRNMSVICQLEHTVLSANDNFQELKLEIAPFTRRTANTAPARTVSSAVYQSLVVTVVLVYGNDAQAGLPSYLHRRL